MAHQYKLLWWTRTLWWCGAQICKVFGHHKVWTGKRIQKGWRTWAYCDRCHIRMSADVEVSYTPTGLVGA